MAGFYENAGDLDEIFTTSAKLEADRAEAAADRAEAAADSADAKIGDLDQAVTDAQVAASNASISETASQDYATEAYHWAHYAEDSLVPEGNNTTEYSAYHWAQKAEDFADQALANSGISNNLSEKIVTLLNVSGAVTLDCALGENTHFVITPNGAITDLSIINTPATANTAYGVVIHFNVPATAQTVTFNSQIKFPDATPPTLDTVSTTTIITCNTVDNGTTYLATFVENFA